MICKRCNEEVEEGRVYCPKCGFELNYAPEYTEVEQELDKNVINLSEAEETDNENNIEEGAEEYHLEKQISAKQRKMQMIAKISILSIVIMMLIVGIVAYFIIKSRNESYSVQLNKGKEYSKDGNFSKAVIAYENAFNECSNKQEKAEVSKLLGLFYLDNSDYKNTIYYLEIAVDNGCLDTDVITALVRSYERVGDSTAIKKLANVASNDETYSLFEKYLLNQPIFNYKSGTYNEYLSVEITSDDNETIYYTLDETTATTSSNVYSGPIEVKDGQTVIHAITVNQNGLESEEVVVKYNVQSAGDVKPEISPVSGQYTDFTKITIDDVAANCKIYYTIDGTDPTEKSIEYKEPFEMPVGNHVIKAVSINMQTKVASEVVQKVYDLDISGKYETSKAANLVIGELYKRNEVINESGALADGTTCSIQFEEETTIDNVVYYIMHRYSCIAGEMIDANTYYAVNIANGDVFLAVKSKEGVYNLDSF